MIKHSNTIYFIIIFLILSVFLFSDPADSVKSIIGNLSPDELIILNNERELTRFHYSAEKPDMVPEIPSAQYLFNDFNDFDHTICVESLFIIEASMDSNELYEKKKLAIYNILQSVATLSGIQYYSVSRKKMRNLVLDSYTVDNIENKKKISDRISDQLDSFSSITQFQNDTSFGKYYNNISYRTGKNNVCMSVTNLTDLKFAFIPIVKEGNLKINLFIILLDNYILFYGNCAVQAVNFPLMPKIKEDSFYNRIKAFFTWFSDMYLKYPIEIQ